MTDPADGTAPRPDVLYAAIADGWLRLGTPFYHFPAGEAFVAGPFVGEEFCVHATARHDHFDVVKVGRLLYNLCDCYADPREALAKARLALAHWASRAGDTAIAAARRRLEAFAASLPPEGGEAGA